MSFPFSSFVYWFSAGIILSFLLKFLPRTRQFSVPFSIFLVGLAFFISSREVILFVGLGILICAEFYFPRDRIARINSDILNAQYLLYGQAARLLPALILSVLGLKFWRPTWGVSSQPIWLQAIIAFFIIDLFFYIKHRGQHAISVWWKFHRVHHSSDSMNCLAYARTHLFELAFVQVLTNLLVIASFGFHAKAVFYGVYIPHVILLNLWAHANLDIPKNKFPLWAYIITSPNVHALHHTKKNDKCNYGGCLTIWDVLFGTFQKPSFSMTQAEFGVENWMAPAGIIGQQLDLSEKKNN